MKKLAITVVTLAAYLAAISPSIADEAPTASQPAAPTQSFVAKGQHPSVCDLANYEAKERLSAPILAAGGAEENTGTIILAVIGALALIGVLIAVSQKNNEAE